MACISSNAGTCNVVNCNAGSTVDTAKSKCDGNVLKGQWEVPAGATSVVMQLHDGQFAGTVNCSATYCAGGSSGSCKTAVSGVCQVVLGLTNCTGPGPGPNPECASDADCEAADLTDPAMRCYINKCNTTTTNATCYKVSAH